MAYKAQSLASLHAKCQEKVFQETPPSKFQQAHHGMVGNLDHMKRLKENLII